MKFGVEGAASKVQTVAIAMAHFGVATFWEHFYPRKAITPLRKGRGRNKGKDGD